MANLTTYEMRTVVNYDVEERAGTVYKTIL